MKNIKLQILFNILLIFLLTQFACFSFSPFEVTALDNPAPGYLRFDWPLSNTFFLVDNYGNIIYESSQSTNLTSNVITLKNGNWAQIYFDKFNIYNSNYTIVDSIPNPTANTQKPCTLDWHTIIQLSNGHYLLLVVDTVVVDMSKIVEGGQTNALVLSNDLIETDRTGQIYWRWNAYDHYKISDITPDIDLTQMVIDWTHINSFVEDSDGGIIVSVRFLDEISKINKSTGNFDWRLGGSKCKNNEFTFINDDQEGFFGFSHQHSVSITDENTILIYDNGNLKNPQYSRSVEYLLNINQKKAVKIWEYRDNPDIYHGSMGSVKRLPNGNTLINWGIKKITEVTPSNKIVYNIGYNNFDLINIYDANREVVKMDAVSKTINSIGNYSFSNATFNTNFTTNISNINGSGNLCVEKHYYSPQVCSFNDSSFSSILPYRWVLSHSGISNISGTLKINLNGISGYSDLKKLSIYKRDNEAKGLFSELSTTYNQSTNELTATISGFGEFLIGSNIIQNAPIILKPDNASFISLSSKLTWSSVQGAKYFQIQIDSTNLFTNPVFNQIINRITYLNLPRLDNSTMYYWRVRALNDKDTSQWSTIRTFTTYLANPVFTFPLNNSLSIQLKDTIRWNKVNLATNYHFQISNSPSFTNILENDDKLTSEKIVVNNLQNNTTYYCRIRAYNSTNTSDWSDTLTFKTILETPILDYPDNNLKNVPVSFVFNWNKVSGADNYILQVCKNDKFSKGMVINNVIDSTNLTVESLENDNSYYWRVKAIRLNDSSDWSEVWNFSTKLESVVLVQPLNQQINVEVNCNFSWREIAPEETYSLQLSFAPDFSSVLLDTNLISSPFITVNGLIPYTKYYWRVKRYLSERESEWSKPWFFVTNQGQKLIPPKLISPKDKSESNNYGKLIWLNVENAIKYRIQLSNSSIFTEWLQDTLINSTTFEFYHLDKNSTYYWRVKSFNKKDSSEWSPLWSFSISNKLELAKLLFPNNEEMQLPTELDLKWEPVIGASNYNLQVSVFPDFHSLNDEFSLLLDSTVHLKGLLQNETYYWRLKYFRDGDSSDWSNIWSFNTLTQHVLSNPKLLSPNDGAIPVPINGELSWTSINEATEYSLSVSTNSSFDNIDIKEKNIQTNTYNYTDLKYNTKYFWRIAAENDSSKSFWSNTHYFTTELETPVFTYPLNNDIDIPLNCNLTWSVSEDNTFYKLQISLDSDFTDLIFDSDKLLELKFNYMFERNTIYYCRVKSVSDSNYSNWSETIKFRTIDPNSVEEINLKDAVIIFPNPSNDNITVKILNNSTYNTAIFNEFGQKMPILPSGNKINISNLPAGIYFLKINSNPPVKFLKI